MNKLSLQLSTHNLIVFHLVQRFVYQYHSLFSERKNHTEMKDLTHLWFLKIFIDNPYFNNLTHSVLVNYEIKENKDLLVVLRAPLNYDTFYISLDKDIKECVTYTNNATTINDVNVFSIDFEL